MLLISGKAWEPGTEISKFANGSINAFAIIIYRSVSGQHSVQIKSHYGEYFSITLYVYPGESNHLDSLTSNTTRIKAGLDMVLESLEPEELQLLCKQIYKAGKHCGKVEIKDRYNKLWKMI